MAENRDFAEFYAATFHRLTSQLFVHTGDLAEAQDVVQEAMVRALSRWSAVSTFEDPAAWCRRVAWNLATSRWRRLRRGVELATTGRHEETTPGPEPDRLAVVGLLAHLPTRQRQAIILHYLEDLPVTEIAELTGAAEGTVKSWLHRGRATLAARLADQDRRREVDHV
ncbi:RNA polymerase sigma-70 factor (ECF subfamily) [Allocatelliglobosispora scoriae]|uniref:RNA polymerase sigma-70 factor (ECF subfamily) n=1 Tax=Allocatelliglobosispora scoriae TaxID=643052 RepID=A0A841BQZ4_9ACTN|nr:SigE family RNA polymerase sigma factor [Allocatelliglobosispora scoriae]MBB5869776.1 RNA polymerase sigma-70 factor (ECF subfamily) [Allocatelliglobosispora scoriae]